MKRLRTINKFNQKHSSLRRFLRLISYGCYHRMLFRGHGINERTYDDELRQMRFFIPESSIIETHQAGHTHISFRGSPYTQTYNFLARNISEAFPSISPPTDIFQFRNNNFTRILDDEVLVTIIQAIKSKKALVARRKDKPTITVLPRAIYTDYIYNRQYIIGRKLLSPGKAEPVSLRIDLLTDIAFAEVPLPPSAATATRLQEIHLRVTFDNAREKSEREDLLISRGAKITSAEPHVFLCTIPAVDPLRLYPWLWSLQPWAEILPGKDGLRRRMEKDLRNMLTDYGLD